VIGSPCTDTVSLLAAAAAAAGTINGRQAAAGPRTQVRYEARLGTRRYEAVDPENRLVAAELESRWNAALERVRQLEKTLQQVSIEPSTTAAVDRDVLLRLAEDLLDGAECVDNLTRIVHILIQEIVANVHDS
jgi:hypothetical protein